MPLFPCICLPLILYPEINGIFRGAYFHFPPLQPHNILKGRMRPLILPSPPPVI